MVMDETTKYQALTSVRQGALVEMVCFSCAIVVSLVVNELWISVAMLGAALGVSISKYRVASRLLGRRGLN